MAAWRNGIRRGLKNLGGNSHVGSSPTAATKQVAMKTPKKNRNAYTIPAKSRKAGVMRPKKDKRKNGKNKQVQYLEETYT
jgi:hypothetical protein